MKYSFGSCAAVRALALKSATQGFFRHLYLLQAVFCFQYLPTFTYALLGVSNGFICLHTYRSVF